MADIDFLASDKRDDEERRKRDGKREAEEPRMHVPEAEPRVPENGSSGGFLSGLLSSEKPKKEEPAAPPKEAPEAPLRSAPIERVKPVILRETPRVQETPLPAPPPPPAPPPSPAPEPPKPPKKDENGAPTLRVSLLATEGGGGLTDLTVRERVRTFLVVLLLAVILDAGIYGGLLWYKSRVLSRIQTIGEGVRDLDRDIAEAEKRIQPAQNYQRMTALASTLLDRHRQWEGLLGLIEERTKTEVQFLNMSGVESGVVSANLVARDYTTIGRQLVALREDPRILSAEIGNVSAEYDENGLIRGARTALTMRFDPSILTVNPARN